jgi:hypothetical protein
MPQLAAPASWLPHPDDELLHEPIGDPSMPWKDTWFFNVYDLAAGFALSVHMTVSANRSPDTRVAVAARLGGRETLHVVREDGVRETTAFGNDLLRLEVLNASWDSAHEIRLVGRLPDARFDLTVVGNHFGSLWDAMFPGFYQSGERSAHTYGHAEQSVRFTGTFAWSGEPAVALSGPGWRDRGWGRRKSTSSFNSGYDMVNGVLPDGGVFTLMAFRSPEVDPAAPLPLGGWYADEESLTPAVAGRFWKDSVGWPEHVELTFANGRRFAATLARRHFSIAVPFHEAEHELVPFAHGIRDYFAELTDDDGRTFPVHANSGHMHLANVTADARFVHADDRVG